MAELLHSGAAMNIERRPVILLLLLVWQMGTTLAYGAGITADNNDFVPMGTAAAANDARYASTKDNGPANAFTDYLKGYGVGMNDFGQHQQDSIEYSGNTQARYGTDDGGGSDEQQSHISAGYHHPQPVTYHHSSASSPSSSGSAYEVPHQSDIDKFVENNFSHQYEHESDAVGGGGGGGYHSASGDEGSYSDYHQNHGGFTASQHQHTDVINYVPYPVVKKLHVPYSKPVQIPISHAVIIPVRKPVPIHIPITKQIQIPVEKELKIPIERLVPYPVDKHIPVPIEKRVPYQVVKYVPVKVPKPYAVKVPVVKTVVHKVKQWW